MMRSSSSTLIFASASLILLSISLQRVVAVAFEIGIMAREKQRIDLLRDLRVSAGKFSAIISWL